MTRFTLGTAVVGGGTGFIGTQLCEALKTLGYGITIISRMPGPQRMTWNELQKKGLPEDTSVVVNLAGQNVMDFKQRWTAGFKQNVFNSRINTTTSLAQEILKAPKKPSVFVTISGVGIYKPDDRIEYNEECVGEEFDFFSKLCQDWESAARLVGEAARRVTIRTGLVLGKTGGMVKQISLPFFLGLGGPMMPGNQIMPWIHIDDLISLILFSIKNNKVDGVLNGVAPDLITNKQFTNAFAKAMGRPAFFPVPEIAFNILLGKERAKMITESLKVVPKKTTQLGFQFKYPNISLACQELVKK